MSQEGREPSQLVPSLDAILDHQAELRGTELVDLERTPSARSRASVSDC